MKKVFETFNIKLRKFVDGQLYELDAYLDVIDPAIIREFHKYLTEPFRGLELPKTDENMSVEERIEANTKISELLENAQVITTERVHEKLPQWWSKKNKDMAVEEFIERIMKNGETFNKFLLKWLTVCDGQTFRGFELDSDGKGD